MEFTAIVGIKWAKKRNEITIVAIQTIMKRLGVLFCRKGNFRRIMAFLVFSLLHVCNMCDPDLLPISLDWVSRDRM